jgi:type II secretory pathway pseudopilin PulG
MKPSRRTVENRKDSPVHPRSSGMTLVEMLVVVALTVLIMSIISEIFVLASQTMSRLQAVSAVNLKMRSIETVLRTDLAHRTIREVQPPVERVLFGPGPDGILGTPDDFYYYRPVGIDPGKNLGYFMIEENSPADEQGEDTDDVLAFTVRLSVSSQTSVSGLGAAYLGNAVPGSEPDNAFLPAGDGVAGSQDAEIIYFLRNGTLYRRVLLVDAPQPTDTNALNPSRFVPPQPWHARYDISARPAPNMTAGPPWPIPIVNTLGDLSYRSTRFGHRLPTLYNTGDPGAPPVTVPPVRPGLAADFPGDVLFQATGYSPGPMEFIDTNGSFLHDATVVGDEVDHNYIPSLNKTSYPFPIGTSPLSVPELWIGRPTLRECSSIGAPPPAGTWDFPDNGNSAVFTKDPRDYDPRHPTTNVPLGYYPYRSAEDVVMVNVLSFDIKVWDPDAVPNPAGTGPATGAFVDLGKMWPGASGSVGTPGPMPTAGSPQGYPGLFPTPAFVPPGPRPFEWPPGPPLPWLGPDGRPGFAGVDDNGNGVVDDTGEMGFAGSDDILAMGPDRKPGFAGVDDDGDGIVDNITELFWPGSDDIRPGGRGFGMPFGWNATPPGPPYAIPPSFGPDGQPGRAGVDDDGNGTVDDISELGWPGSDDDIGMYRCPMSLARTYDTWCSAYTKPVQAGIDGNGSGTIDIPAERVVPVAPPYIVPLRAIQIKIRFVDPSSRLTREVTIVQELK